MTMKTLAALAVAAAATFGTASAFAGPNLVTNGGFESSSYTVSSEFGLAAGGQGVTGWTGNNGYNIWFPSAAASSTENTIGQYTGTGKEKLWGPVASSPGGGAFVGLDGDQVDPGVQSEISQTINGLIVGQQYVLSFDWGAAQMQSRTGPTTEQLQVSLGGQTQSTSIVNNPSQSFTGWFGDTLYFTATTASETLSFLSVGTPGGLPPMAVLDDVNLQVPEPMSLALLGSGLIGLGVVRRIRRKS